MERYRVECKIDGNYTRQEIECREISIEHNSYCFWVGQIGQTNRLAWAFPVMFTIIECLTETN